MIRTDALIGPAYKLVHETTGKPVSRLVNFDCLKIYNERAPNLDANSPQGIETRSSDDVSANDCLSHRPGADSRPKKQKQTAKKLTLKSRLQRAIQILKERRYKGVRQFLVLFVDRTCDWSSNVSPGLLNEYENGRRIKQRRRMPKQRQ